MDEIFIRESSIQPYKYRCSNCCTVFNTDIIRLTGVKIKDVHWEPIDVVLYCPTCGSSDIQEQIHSILTKKLSEISLDKEPLLKFNGGYSNEK